MPTVDTIVDLLTSEGASIVVEYGSSVHSLAAANDVDLLAIYDEEPRQNVRIGAFEVIRLAEHEYHTYERVLNPVYCTEPVLKGVARRESALTLEALRSRLSDRSPSPEAVGHNVKRSYAEYHKAIELAERGNVGKTIETLSFVTSYRLFAQWYASGNEPATLDHVREHLDTHVPHGAVFDLREQHKDGAEVPVAAVEAVLETWHEAVLQP